MVQTSVQPRESRASAGADAPAVSVIIPAYKLARFIRETLESVFAQTFTDYEIIIVNDGSPDTEELERELAPYRARIVYLKQENRGAGAARNAGLRAARGRYVAFLDGDDLWLPDYLSEQMRFIQSCGDGGYDWVYADALYFGAPQLAGRTYMETCPSTGELTCESLLAERCNVITSGVVARRELVLEVGLFDETIRNSQDYDLWLRMAKRAGVRMNYQRQVLLKHRRSEGSLSFDSIKSTEGTLRVLDKTEQRGDLTEGERAALKRTRALRRATLAIDRGKRSLLEGDFAGAAQSFAAAADYFRGWKLRLALLWLRVSPRTLRLVYKLRRS